MAVDVAAAAAFSMPALAIGLAPGMADQASMVLALALAMLTVSFALDVA